jgi:hypothetical protein
LLEIQWIVAVNNGFVQGDFYLFQDFVKSQILFEKVDGLLHDILVFTGPLKITHQENGFVLEFSQFLECKNPDSLFLKVGSFIS